MNHAINTFYRANFCPLSFKRRLAKLCIKFENNKFPLTLMATSRKKVTKNSNVKFKGMLFRYKMNNQYETNILLAHFIYFLLVPKLLQSVEQENTLKSIGKLILWKYFWSLTVYRSQ